ncbi:YibE/F family protein [Fusibacter bizertensis]
MKNLDKKMSKSKMLQTVVFALILLIFFAFVYWLNQPIDGDVPTAASQVKFAKAHVSELIVDNARADTWTEGLRLGSQEIVLTIDSGEYKNVELPAQNYLGAYGNVDLNEGTKIIVRLDVDENDEPYVLSIVNYDRSTMLISLAVIFIGLLVLLGGKKGISALLGLSFTIFSIWFFLIPLIKRGIPSIPASILLVAITTFVSLVALNGFSKKTFSAIIGCVGGVAIAGLIAYIAGRITPINGFNMSEAEELVLRSSDDGLLISGLLVSGILIASLGAVMDVALMITSAVSELHEMNPNAKRSELIKSGLNIGRDAMGTMANTLILAFAGASLNMLVLFRVFDYPYLQIFNSDMMTIEIIQGLAGSIGIVLTVPLVAALSASMYGKIEPHQK